MDVLRVFNNNVVLAKDGNSEVILTGRGIGFQAKPGQHVDDAKIVRRFVPADGKDPDHMAQQVAGIPPEIIRLVTDAMNRTGLKEQADRQPALVLALSDHICGAIDPYSSGVGKAFVAAAKKNGLDVVAEENSSSADDTEYSSQLQKIEASGAEFLYAPYYYSTVGPYIVPQARAVGYEGYIMGPDGYDGLKTTGNKANYNKVLYTTHYSPDDKSNTKVQQFITSYKKANNGESPNTFTALGYDSVYMFKRAIEQAGENATRADIRNAIAGMSFSGVTGAFTLDKHGSPKKSVIVLEMSDGEPTYKDTIQPAK